VGHGTFVDLEELLEQKFGLPQAIIARALNDSEESAQRAVGSGNTFSTEELQSLEVKGAAGNICLRFYNANGEEIENAFSSRVLGLELRRLKHGIVRTTVVTPPGAFAELEELIEHRFGLGQVIIGEATSDSEEAVRAAIGSAAAQFLEAAVKSGEVIGISSWSASLLSTVDQMHPIRKVGNCLVVQLLGGIGSPSAEQHANHLAVRLARLVHGDARFLPVPGIVGSASAAKVLLRDPNVSNTVALFEKVTLALVGIGSLEPSALVASSGNIFSREELETVQKQGAVGDICLRFYDAKGQPVRGGSMTG